MPESPSRIVEGEQVSRAPSIYDQVAGAIIKMEPPHPSWKNQGVCFNPPEAIREVAVAAPEEAPRAVRNATERRFIRRVCGRCAVKQYCFVDGVLTGAHGVARGGVSSATVGRYVRAYNRLSRQGGALDDTIPISEQM